MIDLSFWLLLAYDAAQGAAAPADAPKPAPQGGGSFFESPLFPIMICVVIVIFFLQSRPKEDKKQKALIDSLKKNDRVVTAGGIYGIVANVKPDADEIVLKIDEDKDVKITVMKSAILRKDTQGDEAKEKPAAK